MTTPTRALAAAFALILAAAPALATTTATGDEIRAAIAGKTVQGSMSNTGAYTEFYAEDGTIKGKDYTGKWTIEGDTMCFTYSEAPACWQVAISGDQVTWIENGANVGTGTIVPGNPNGF